MDYAIAIDATNGHGQMTFVKSSTIMNNIYLSLMLRRGSYFADPAFGSRLHLLKRAKDTARTARLAMDYCKEALQWMLDTGRAASVQVYAKRDLSEHTRRLMLLVEGIPPQGGNAVTFTTFIEVI